MADSPFGGVGPWSGGGWPSERFPDPFNDVASMSMPTTMQHALHLCERVFLRNGVYRQAVDRVLSYFITEVDFQDAGDDEKKQYKRFFERKLGIYNELKTIGLDYLCYGNSMLSMLLPIRRFLCCPKCKKEYTLTSVFKEPKFGFKWSGFEFYANCPDKECRYSGVWKHKDRRGDEQEVRIKRWNLHEIEILYDDHTGDCAYIWKIPDDYKKKIREGHLFHLERANWEIIQAIKHNQHFYFDKDVIFHLKEDCLSGVRTRGWGVSRTLTNYGDVFYVQVLRRQNEAIGLDYVVPFRVITPMPQASAADASARDPIFNMNMGGFTGKIKAMLAEHRQDPGQWNISPFPLQYVALGGDSSKFAPTELLNQAYETLLCSIGVPTELFKGSLQIQSAPAALRLFESNWTHLVHALNRVTRWIARRTSELLSWDPVEARLTRVTTADDMDRRMAILQLMQGQQVSKQTGLRTIGLDNNEERERQKQEARSDAESQAELGEELEQMSQMAQLGKPQPGGAPGQPGVAPGQQGGDPNNPTAQANQGVMAQQPIGDNQPVTLQDFREKSITLAKQLMSLPDSQRASELIALKKSSPELHAQVKAQMDQIRQQAKAQGGAMLLGQLQGQPQGQ